MGMGGGEQLERSLSFLDIGHIEEGEGNRGGRGE
jgi:hypothetical protein